MGLDHVRQSVARESYFAREPTNVTQRRGPTCVGNALQIGNVARQRHVLSISVCINDPELTAINVAAA